MIEWMLSRLSDLLDFHVCIERCDLLALKWVGQRYTWCNKHTDGTRAYSNIDKAFSNLARVDLFGAFPEHRMAEDISNHSPIYVQMTTHEEKRFGKFKFF